MNSVYLFTYLFIYLFIYSFSFIFLTKCRYHVYLYQKGRGIEPDKQICIHIDKFNVNPVINAAINYPKSLEDNTTVLVRIASAKKEVKR